MANLHFFKTKTYNLDISNYEMAKSLLIFIIFADSTKPLNHFNIFYMCNKDSNINFINNVIASIIVGVTIIGIIVAVIVVYCKQKAAPKLQNVKIELKADSTLTISYDDKIDIIDSLENIMQRHERLLENKYQYVIDKRAIEDSIFSKGGAFISIVLAILAFFGFKSFQSIEDKAKQASEAATKAAEEAAKEAAEETKDKIHKITNYYLSKHLRSEVDRAITEDQVPYIESLVNEYLRNHTMESLKETESLEGENKGTKPNEDVTIPVEPDNIFLKKN